MRLAAVIATALLVCGICGYAIAGPGATQKPIKACAKKKGGALRLAKRCRTGERRVSWSKAGPVGPAGVAGAQGQAGAAGKDGADGAPGAAGQNGTDGSSTGETFYAESVGAAANFGSGTCTTTPGGPSITFDAPAGAYATVVAQAGMQRAGAASNDVCVNVDGTNIAAMESTSLAVETRYIQQGTAAGTTDRFSTRPLVFPVSAGSHTVSLRYTSVGGTSMFSNRRLWVTLARPAG